MEFSQSFLIKWKEISLQFNNLGYWMISMCRYLFQPDVCREYLIHFILWKLKKYSHLYNYNNQLRIYFIFADVIILSNL